MDRDQLMKEILKVIYTDSEEEKRLCIELLKICDPKQDPYGCAFAYMYLFDGYSATGNFEDGSFYLEKAKDLCHKYGFEDLLVTLYNLAGIFFTHMNDEHTALDYYTEGLKICRRLKHYEVENKILCNIGMAFSNRGDYNTAAEYFAKCYKFAYERALQYSKELDGMDEMSEREKIYEHLISTCYNYSETILKIGDIEAANQALNLCKEFSVESVFHKMGVLSAFCRLYAKSNEKDLCMQTEEKVRDTILERMDNSFFLCGMAEGIAEIMIEIQEKERAWTYLELLKKKIDKLPLTDQYSIQYQLIKYYEKYGSVEEINKGYKDYYNIICKCSEVDDKVHAQSLMVKIQSANINIEREEIKEKNSELKNAGHHDELTGLYNRRYLNEIASEMASDTSVRSLGMIMIDVDYFKEYNDLYGHFMGDEILKEVAQVLLEAAIEGVWVSRYGGDEFVCLCVNLSDEKVDNYVEKIQCLIGDKMIIHKGSKVSDVVTISIGYCNEANNRDLERLGEIADKALYQVKRNGRNGCVRKHVTEG